MPIKILMPSLSPTMTEGILQKWLVKVGDEIKAGDVIAEIETDKATMQIESVDEGKITKIIVKEGTKGVSVNSIIAILNGSENDVENKDKKVIQKNKSEIENIKKLPKKDNDLVLKKKIIKRDDNIIASPFAKKLAKDKNINLNTLQGSGPSGRIIKRDFEKLDSQDHSFLTSSNYTIIKPSSIRKIIAERTTKTKVTVPHFYLTIESEVDKLLTLRKKINEQNLETKVSINDILVKALAIAQNKNPQTNVSWLDGQIIKYSSVDVSIAVALKDGLITPIIKNADNKGLLDISSEIKKLVSKAKEGKLTPDEYTGGTISISNLGMYGITEFAAIINPPQSSILAVGSIQKKAMIKGGDIKVVNILKSTLSADHRVLDGAIAAKLLNDFNDIIENPFILWLQSKDMKVI